MKVSPTTNKRTNQPTTQSNPTQPNQQKAPLLICVSRGTFMETVLFVVVVLLACPLEELEREVAVAVGVLVKIVLVILVGRIIVAEWL